MLQKTTLNALIIAGVLYHYLERDKNDPNYGHYHITVTEGHLIQTSDHQTINHIEGLNHELWMFEPDDEVNHIGGGEVNHELQNNLGLDDELELYVYKILEL